MNIIAVGFSPAWDITCIGDNLNWGDHKEIESAESVPAGKALNVCKTLAWMRCESTVCGLWGALDWERMACLLKPYEKYMAIKLTKVAGSTRRNITVIDRAGGREMHLRSPSMLANDKNIARLASGVKRLVRPGSFCVFSGAFPPIEFEQDAMDLIDSCQRRGGRIVVDTSGPALAAAVNSGLCQIIKPNVDELRELVGSRVADRPAALVKAGKELTEKVPIVLISRSSQGAILVTRGGCWQGQAQPIDSEALSTVGCGDNLLAGFLYGMKTKLHLEHALETGIQMATAKAYQLNDTMTWPAVRKTVKVKIEKIAD